MISSNATSRPRTTPQKDTFISISLALYVFSAYLINTPFTRLFGSAVLFGFLGLTFFKLVTRQAPLKFTAYIMWYFAFGVVGVLSLFYAVNNDFVFSALYTLFVALILSFAFVQYMRNCSYFVRIFQFFAYIPLFSVLFFFASGQIGTQDQRLGSSAFGNANNLALLMMISLCCISWLIIYGNTKYLLINASLAIVFLYITILTGGRKFFLVPFIFFFTMLVLRLLGEKKLRLLLYLTAFMLFAFVSAWAIIHIPTLYNSIGIRFEALLNLLNGNPLSTDASTKLRYYMITHGWVWFLQRPLLGYGLNNYQSLFLELIRPSYAHNNYIELLVDLGMVGAFFYYSFYVYLIAKLIGIRDDATGIRNFFLAFMLALLVFEIGAVTYNLNLIQIFLGLASAYIWLYKTNNKEFVK